MNSPQFLILALETLYNDYNFEKDQEADEACLSFKPLKPYNGSDSSGAELVVQLPQCMLDLLD